MPPHVRHDKTVLSNGLRVVTVELPYLHTASLVVYARVGSRYETPKDNGLSHFLEHMLFRGTSSRPSSYALNLAIEELGGTLYAETGRDYSLYQISLDPELVPQGIGLLGEIFVEPALTQIEMERQIILEELSEDYDEKGRDLNLYDLTRRTIFGDHPLGQKITGPTENVERFDLDDVRRHFAGFYGAENLIFCVSGPVPHGRVLDGGQAALSRLPRGQVASATPPREATGGPIFTYVENPGAQTSLAVLFRAIPETDPDFVAMQALSRILDDGMSTRLHYQLCDQLGLAYYVQGSIDSYHDAALIEVDGASTHAKFPDLVARTLELLGKFRTEPVTAAELTKAKRRYRFDLAAAFDDPDAMAGWYGAAELFYPAPSFADKVAKMEAVAPDDIRRVARRVFQPERLVVGASGKLTVRQKRAAEKLVKDWA
jgi:predicted Zn-dependent peptidase